MSNWSHTSPGILHWLAAEVAPGLCYQEQVLGGVAGPIPRPISGVFLLLLLSVTLQSRKLQEETQNVTPIVQGLFRDFWRKLRELRGFAVEA